ncbi:MAG: hypothetical protein EOO20_15020 [Chryseobacterium sp.]|nr:MAG: hypothetical protein EOO20_15020 [Chryseobacterium sp.]
MRQFKIEVAIGDEGRFYDITALGDFKYEIFVEGDSIGTVQLDKANPAHCDNIGCQLDSPALHAIRDGILYHESLDQEE